MQKLDILKGVPIVKISPSGKFKYILIVGQQNDKQWKFVRGNNNLEYHAENFAQFKDQLHSQGFKITKFSEGSGKFTAQKGQCTIKFKCPGGGRIQHNHGGNKCFIYGYSQSYGAIDHTIAQKLISTQLGYSIAQIKTSQQGY